MQELVTGNSDLVIAGAVDLDQTLFSYQAFCSARALSPTGKCRPFDRHADGTLLSEGAVVFILKRLDNAEQDGDRIYACINSIESASDGRGLSLTAPNPLGQHLAITRALLRARIKPNQMTLYEAHGTGTVLGDTTELATLSSIMSTYKNIDCTISSAKGAIGHTKTCAGMVGILKAALALYHRVLPPMLGTEHPIHGLNETPSSGIHYLRNPEQWTTRDEDRRIAGVSAFGFGGINYHAVMEESPTSLTPVRHADQSWPFELRGENQSDLKWIVRNGRIEVEQLGDTGSNITACDTVQRSVPISVPEDKARGNASHDTQNATTDPAYGTAPKTDATTSGVHDTSSEASLTTGYIVEGAVSSQRQVMSCAELMDLVIAAIAHVTGYPRNTITGMADLSADLGVDSIGKIEILEFIEESADVATSEFVNSQVDWLNACKTVGELVEAIRQGVDKSQLSIDDSKSERTLDLKNYEQQPGRDQTA
jgi:hypothetical protein